MKNSTFPIFPLPVFILPGGKVRLRIFEKKYQKMLSLISAHQTFVIKLVSESFINDNHWGSLVKIMDFNQGKDGLLEIDVLCVSLVYIMQFESDENNLTFAQITPFLHWSQNQVEESMSSKELAKLLNDVMNNSEILSQLYQSRPLENIHWVIARWIELLPVKLTVKNLFGSIDSFPKAKDFVNSVIYK